jgi:hypothetical protein
MFMIAVPFLVFGSELHYWRSGCVTGEDKIASLNRLELAKQVLCTAFAGRFAVVELSEPPPLYQVTTSS